MIRGATESYGDRLMKEHLKNIVKTRRIVKNSRVTTHPGVTVSTLLTTVRYVKYVASRCIRSGKASES